MPETPPWGQGPETPPWGNDSKAPTPPPSVETPPWGGSASAPKSPQPGYIQKGIEGLARFFTEAPAMVGKQVKEEYQAGKEQVAGGVEGIKSGKPSSVIAGLAADFLGTARQAASPITGLAYGLNDVFNKAGGDPNFVPGAAGEANMARLGAKEPSPLVTLYRFEPKEQKVAPVADWIKESPQYQNTLKATGRWFTDDPEEAMFYAREYPGGNLTSIRLPKEQAEKYRVSNMKQQKDKTVQDNPFAFSARPDKEFYIDPEIAAQRKPVEVKVKGNKVTIEGKTYEYRDGKVVIPGTAEFERRKYDVQGNEISRQKEKVEGPIPQSVMPKVESAGSPKPIEASEKISGATITYKGKVYTGTTHIDALDKLGRDVDVNSLTNRDIENGFVTDKGRVITRAEALQLAKREKQTTEPNWQSGELHSGHVVNLAPKSVGAEAPEKAPLPATPSKEFTGNLSDQLYQMRQANQADKLEFQHAKKSLSPEMLKAEKEGAVNRYMGGDQSALPDNLKQEYAEKIQPTKNEETELFKDLRGMNELDDETLKEIEESLEPNYVRRVSASHPNVYDRNLNKNEGQPYTGQGSRLPQTTSSLQSTKYDVIENAQGVRKVVAKNKDGTLSVINKGQNPTAIKPELKSTETELKYNKPFAHEGQEWTLKRATAEELEAATGEKYHKFGILNTYENVERLRNLKRSLSILKALRSSDEWAAYTRSINDYNAPADYRVPTVDIPALRGVKVDPRLAEVVEDVWKNKEPGKLGDAIDTINDAYMNVMFMNPIPHEVNVGAWNVIANAPDAFRLKSLQETYAQAIREVKNTGPIYRELLKNGMAGQYARQINHDYWRKMLDGIGEAVVEDPKRWTGFANQLGFNKVSEFFQAWSKASNNHLWKVNDILLTQRVLMTMKTRGWSMQRAIKEAESVIPNYRVPSRILDDRLLSRAFTTNRAFMFGRYHWNSLSNLGTIIQRTTRGDKDAAIRLAALVLGGMLINEGVDSMTDNETIKRWFGFGPWTIPMRIVNNVRDVKSHKEGLSTGIARVGSGSVMMSPVLDMIRSAFFEGRDYVGREITQKEDTLKNQAGQWAAFFASKFPYATEAENARQLIKQGNPLEAAKDFAETQVGIRTQKPYNEKPKTAERNLKARKKHPRNIIEEFLP